MPFIHHFAADLKHCMYSTINVNNTLINMQMSNVTHVYLILKSLLFITLLHNLKHYM
jgi:hypothetical protein